MKLYHIYYNYGYDGISTIAICTSKQVAFQFVNIEREKFDPSSSSRKDITIDVYEANSPSNLKTILEPEL